MIVLSWLNANPARHNSTWTTKRNIEQTLPAQLRNPNIFIFSSHLNPTRAPFINASINELFMPPGLCRLLIKQREHTETSLPTLRASTTKESSETTAFLDPNLKYQSKEQHTGPGGVTRFFGQTARSSVSKQNRELSQLSSLPNAGWLTGSVV